MNNLNNKKLTVLALLCAMAYLLMVTIKIPVILFLKYEPKDIIITLGGFLYGPAASVIISSIVSVLEMFTASDTGIIGLIMNVLASCSFACTAAWIYHKNPSQRSAFFGLLAGTACLTVTMLVWNYIFLPIFLHFPRAEVAKLLFPAILPFNLLKGTLNTALILLLYRHVLKALENSGLLPVSSQKPAGKNWLTVAAVFLLLTCLLVAAALRGWL